MATSQFALLKLNLKRCSDIFFFFDIDVILLLKITFFTKLYLSKGYHNFETYPIKQKKTTNFFLVWNKETFPSEFYIWYVILKGCFFRIKEWYFNKAFSAKDILIYHSIWYLQDDSWFFSSSNVSITIAVFNISCHLHISTFWIKTSQCRITSAGQRVNAQSFVLCLSSKLYIY